MISLRTLWQRITTSRYTHALEASARMESALREEVARQGAEIDRLRAENRALLNSILGIAGVPPLPAIDPAPPSITAQTVEPRLYTERGPEASKDFVATGFPRLSRPDSSSGSPPSSPSLGRGARKGAATKPDRTDGRRGASVAVPMRRRSWQQINRILEFESAKKKEVTSG